MHRSTQRAFTLVELLLGLAVTAMVAASLAALSQAAFYGSDQARDVQRAQSAAAIATIRIRTAVRECRAIGYVGAGGAALWRDDANRDGRINLSEVATLWQDDRELKYTTIELPRGTYDLQISETLFRHPLLIGVVDLHAHSKTVVWTERLNDLTLTPWPAGADAKGLNVRLTLDAGAATFVTETAAGLRGRGTDVFTEAP